MTADKTTIVRIKIEEGKTGLFYATSPDLPGLLVGEPTIDALEDAIPTAIADLMLAACGAKVVVTRAKNADPEFYPWVVMPTDVARRVGETAASAI
jgi:hypothetical protein